MPNAIFESFIEENREYRSLYEVLHVVTKSIIAVLIIESTNKRVIFRACPNCYASCAVHITTGYKVWDKRSMRRCIREVRLAFRADVRLKEKVSILLSRGDSSTHIKIGKKTWI